MKKIKSSMLIVMIAIGFASFVSCNNNKNAQTADGSDSTAVVSEALEDQEVAEMSAFINSVASCLDSIQVQENMIFNHPEGTTDKQHMLAQLRSFKELLARKQQQIDALTAKNKAQEKSSKQTIANLQKMVEYLNAQLAEKTARIAELEELVQTKDVKIDELRYNVKELTNESDYLKEQNYQQDKELNKRYYCVGSKKELSEKGLLKGGFLKKKKVNNAAIDKSLFKTVDVRSFKTLKLQSKKPKLVSGNPQGSYTIEKNGDGTSTLTIVDAEKFWKASAFLIIEL